MRAQRELSIRVTPHVSGIQCSGRVYASKKAQRDAAETVMDVLLKQTAPGSAMPCKELPSPGKPCQNVAVDAAWIMAAACCLLEVDCLAMADAYLISPHSSW